MPEGLEVREAGPWILGPRENAMTLTIVRGKTDGQAGEGEIDVRGLVGMPGGPVSIVSEVRPMFSRPRADERDDATSNNQARRDVGAERP
jgi:hypothetical protein